MYTVFMVCSSGNGMSGVKGVSGVLGEQGDVGDNQSQVANPFMLLLFSRSRCQEVAEHELLALIFSRVFANKTPHRGKALVQYSRKY